MSAFRTNNQRQDVSKGGSFCLRGRRRSRMRALQTINRHGERSVSILAEISVTVLVLFEMWK